MMPSRRASDLMHSLHRASRCRKLLQYYCRALCSNKKGTRKSLICFGSGERIRTSDLWVMSPTSYRTAPPRVTSNIVSNTVVFLNHERFVVKVYLRDSARK